MMNSDLSFPYTTPAIKIEQPLGIFYVVSLPANLLLDVTFSTPAKAVKQEKNIQYNIFGTQRKEKTDRLKEIARYINTVEAAFPNSIIIGANYNKTGDHITDEEIRWHINKDSNNNIFHLTIPTKEKLASLIDGQHRLHAFEHSEEERRLMPLLCAVYLDIPLPYHAYIFATINFNQKKVDKSLAYELFGFNVDGEPPNTWAPETLAVYLVRLLNSEEDSPFYNHIKLGVQDTYDLIDDNWQVSMATVVDGILSLISMNPKKDRDLMHKKSIRSGRKREDLHLSDNTPLREMFLKVNDKGIYLIIKMFFDIVTELFWSKAEKRSYIIKTVGVQALFDILKLMMTTYSNDPNRFNHDFIKSKLIHARNIDFSNDFFQASGTGRVRVKNSIGISVGLTDLDSMRISDADKNSYRSICG